MNETLNTYLHSAVKRVKSGEPMPVLGRPPYITVRTQDSILKLNQAKGAAKNSSNAKDFQLQLIEGRKKDRGAKGNAIAHEKEPAKSTEVRWRKKICPDVVK